VYLVLLALFAFLIIRLFKLVFLAGIVFFSHNKSAGSVFRLVFSAKRMGPWSWLFSKFGQMVLGALVQRKITSSVRIA